MYKLTRLFTIKKRGGGIYCLYLLSKKKTLKLSFMFIITKKINDKWKQCLFCTFFSVDSCSVICSGTIKVPSPFQSHLVPRN